MKVEINDLLPENKKRKLFSPERQPVWQLYLEETEFVAKNNSSKDV